MCELVQFSPLPGASGATQNLYDLVAMAVPNEASVPIWGERDTGRELVAQSIHRLSRRTKGRFLPFNCGAIEASCRGGAFLGPRRRVAGLARQGGDQGRQVLHALLEEAHQGAMEERRAPGSRSVSRIPGNIRVLRVEAGSRIGA